MIEWYQVPVVMAIGMAFVLLAVLLGGWLVFRTKTITMPSPFLQDFKKDKKPKKPHSYVSDLYEDPLDIMDETLTPAASRLRDQKMTEKERTLKAVKGKG